MDDNNMSDPKAAAAASARHNNLTPKEIKTHGPMPGPWGALLGGHTPDGNPTDPFDSLNYDDTNLGLRFVPGLVGKPSHPSNQPADDGMLLGPAWQAGFNAGRQSAPYFAQSASLAAAEEALRHYATESAVLSAKLSEAHKQISHLIESVRQQWQALATVLIGNDEDATSVAQQITTMLADGNKCATCDMQKPDETDEKYQAYLLTVAGWTARTRWWLLEASMADAHAKAHPTEGN